MNNDDPTLESELRSRFRRLGLAIDRTASPKSPLQPAIDKYALRQAYCT